MGLVPFLSHAASSLNIFTSTPAAPPSAKLNKSEADQVSEKIQQLIYGRAQSLPVGLGHALSRWVSFQPVGEELFKDPRVIPVIDSGVGDCFFIEGLLFQGEKSGLKIVAIEAPEDLFSSRFNVHPTDHSSIGEEVCTDSKQSAPVVLASKAPLDKLCTIFEGIEKREKDDQVAEGSYFRGLRAVVIASECLNHDCSGLGNLPATFNVENDPVAARKFFEKLRRYGVPLFVLPGERYSEEQGISIAEKDHVRVHYSYKVPLDLPAAGRSIEALMPYILSKPGLFSVKCAKAQEIEKYHGRIEEREVVVISNLEWLNCCKQWRDLTTIIEVTTRRTITGKTSEVSRYYISNLILTPEKAMKLVRDHRQIENYLHWMMDVIFREDES